MKPESCAWATRVITLESLIESHQLGMTPQQIVEAFPSLELGDIFIVLGYYLRHPQHIEEYLHQQRRRGDGNKARADTGFDRDTMRARLHERAHKVEA